MGRCLEIGEIPEAKSEFIQAAEHGQDAVLAGIRDGVKASDLIARAKGALAEKGFMPTPFVSHGMGLTEHEPPTLTEPEPLVIRRGMVLAFEVWIYDIKGITRGGRIGAAPGEERTNLGHFGLEEYIVVTDDGCEMLSTFPREIRTIPP